MTLPEKPQTSGAYAEVYKGTQDEEAVAVKVLRTSNQESTAMLKKVSMDYGRGGKHVEKADSTTDSAFAGR